MATNETPPTLDQLRTRQTQLVLGLAQETSSARLAAMSDELEELLNVIQKREAEEQGSQVPQREDGIVVEPGADLDRDLQGKVGDDGR